MKCPRDGTSLEKVSILQMELDKCHKCDGIWCDAGEMERMRELRAAGIEEAIGAKYGDPEYREGATDGYMRCPGCSGRLQRYSYSYVTPIELDRCEKCFGIWLDDTELDKVVGDSKKLTDMTEGKKLAQLVSAFPGSGK